MVKYSEDPAENAYIECVSEVMKCKMPGCDENTMAFYVVIEKCDEHIPDRRLQCYAKSRLHCVHKRLGSKDSVFLHWCVYHSPNFKRQIFELRSQNFKPLHGPSTDFTLDTAGESMMVISGRDFDGNYRDR